MKLPAPDAALSTILAAVEPVDREAIPAAHALGRVLAADLTVPADVPDLPRSAVDGYAVGSRGRREFTVVGETTAGGAPLPPLAAGEAAAVMTGAVVPPGATAVVMVEHATVDGDRLTIDGTVTPGDLVDPAGSEARRGDPLARAGTRLDAASHPAVMCAGLPEVAVHRRPRVGILVTGDEVTGAGADTPPGHVNDTNGFIIAAVVGGLGCEVTATRHVPDDPDLTAAALADLGAACDLVVTSGGVSAGRHDHVGKLLRADPDRLLLQGTAIKPGRPMHVARLAQGALVFALPGYPASLLTCAFLYLVPAVKRLTGRTDTATRWLTATLGDPMRHRPGRHDYNRATLELVGGAWVARDPGSQLSSHFLNFARVQGLVRMPTDPPPGHEGGAAILPTGSPVDVLHLALELA